MARTVKSGRVPAAAAWVVVPGLLLAALGGCDGGSFVPPPAPELNALPGLNPNPTALSVAMIFPPAPAPDHEVWEQAARLEAARAKVIFVVTRPSPGDPPARQAELIRDAAASKTSALLVDPADDPKVVEALNDARAGGTTVVLIGRRVPDRDPAKPLARATFVPIEEPARRLVGAMVKDVKADGLPADGLALIVTRAGAGAGDRETADALAAELKAAGFAGPEVVTIENDIAKGTQVLEDRIKADPKVTALLALGETEISAAINARKALKEAKRVVVVGGCLSINSTLTTEARAACAGVLDRSQPSLAAQAFRLAYRLAQGEAAPVVREVPIPLLERLPAPPTAPEDPATKAYKVPDPPK
jgi:ABC-type sugar transport system substrate-binding protein